MPTTPKVRHTNHLTLLEESLHRYSRQLKTLERLWGPLQKYASCCALLLCIIGVVTSLFNQTYYHWLITAPAIGILMLLDIVIDDLQIALSSMTDEVHHVLDVSRTVQTGTVNSAQLTFTPDR